VNFANEATAAMVLALDPAKQGAPTRALLPVDAELPGPVSSSNPRSFESISFASENGATVQVWNTVSFSFHFF
jgi:hypothetical protein